MFIGDDSLELRPLVYLLWTLGERIPPLLKNNGRWGRGACVYHL